MNCENCRKAEAETRVNGIGYYYRWNNANIGLVGCREHIKEIIDFLNTKKNGRRMEEE